MNHEETLAIVGSTAFLGRQLDPVANAVILVRGREISASGPAEKVPIPDGARVVDASGGAVIPGFIDAHVHIGLADPSEVLRRGVTTVRDLAWPLDRISELARRSKDRDFDGPLILTAGPMLTVEGGYPITARWAPAGTGLAIRSLEDAAEAVARLVDEGVSIIKVALNPPAGNVLDADLLARVCDEAHTHERLVTAHIYGLGELDKALDAGIDELAHMLMSPETLPEDTIMRLVENHIRVVPTLAVFPRDQVEIAIDNVARFVARGGNVVYGTDLGNDGPQPGIDALEVTRMSAAGIPVLDIVRSATVDAAWWLDLEHKGFLEPGMDADIVCLDRVPKTAADLTRVSHVVREGRVAV